MKNSMWAFGIGLCFALSAPIASAMATEVKLHIPPVVQERPSWCWVAVGEMVFKYYDIPTVHLTDFQCGIAQGMKLCGGAQNCSECEIPDSDSAAMATMLQQYPSLVAGGGSVGEIALTVQSKTGSLSEAEVKQEIDEGRPIIARVSPSGFKINGISQHMALIVGYDDSSGTLKLTVNDPFPFEDDRFLWIGNPYQPNMDMSEENDGQYEISFERFRSKVKWNQTIYRMTCTRKGCPSDHLQGMGSVAGKGDREVIQAVLAAAPDEFQTLRMGHKAVDHTGSTWRSNVFFAGAKQCLVRDKDGVDGAQWSCTFKFSDRSEADIAVEDIVKRLRASLPDGWAGTGLDQDSDTELYTRTDKFIANKPGAHSTIRVYYIDVKQSGRVTVHLSVQSPLPIHP